MLALGAVLVVAGWLGYVLGHRSGWCEALDDVARRVE